MFEVSRLILRKDMSMACTLNPSVQQKIIGHRGSAGLAPENTFESFELAKANGLNWVEFDVQRCATGEWVVIHDDTLDRTTKGKGYISNTSYTEIKALLVPDLEETLRLLLTLNLQPNIEIKGSYPDLDEAMDAFLALLYKIWPSIMPPPLISSFNLDLLLSLKSKDPHLLLGYNIENFSFNALNTAKQHGLYSLHCHYPSLTEEVLSVMDQKPFPLLAYTVNDPHIAHRLLQHPSVAAIFSDFPNLIS